MSYILIAAVYLVLCLIAVARTRNDRPAQAAPGKGVRR